MSSTRPPVTSDSTEFSRGFAPIAGRGARVLVLGSLPSQRSIAEQQYYAHPQNAFWRIMGELAGATGGYEQRCAALIRHRIAVWDVLAASVRPGSLDADIELESAQVNDFESFFRAHPDLVRICFNGRKAAQMFERFAGALAGPLELVSLPSTSPAFAAMRFDDKLARWREGLGL
jgi:double-stranded uracil-DNA glycosylase